MHLVIITIVIVPFLSPIYINVCVHMFAKTGSSIGTIFQSIVDIDVYSIQIDKPILVLSFAHFVRNGLLYICRWPKALGLAVINVIREAILYIIQI